MTAFRALDGLWRNPRRKPISGAGRGILVPGTYLPDAATTGVPADISLEAVTQPVRVVSKDQTFRNMRFENKVTIAAPGARFIDCEFVGPATAVSGAIIEARSPLVRDLLLEDCTIKPRVVNDKTHAFYGHHFTWRRVNSSGAVDALSIWAYGAVADADATVEACWLHDLAFFSPTATQSENATHNDTIEIHGGGNIDLWGNRIEGFLDPAIGNASTPPTGTWPVGHLGGNPYYPNMWGLSSVMFASDGTPINRLQIRENWINGGEVGLNFKGSSVALLPDAGEVYGNRFGSDFQRGADYGILADSTQTMDLHDNYRWVPGDPMNASTPFNVRKAS